MDAQLFRAKIGQPHIYRLRKKCMFIHLPQAWVKKQAKKEKKAEYPAYHLRDAPAYNH